MMELTAEQIEKRDQRLAALLMTIPGWGRHYTASLDAAKWVITEAEKVGWVVTIEEPK